MERLTKVFEQTLYRDGSLDLVRADYRNSEEHLYESGVYVKNYSFVNVIIENENGEIAFYKHFHVPSGKWYCLLLTTEILEEDIDPIATAIRLADDGFSITLKNPALIVNCPMHFSEVTDENIRVIHARCSDYKQEECDEIFWIEKSKVFELLKNQLINGCKFADDCYLNAQSVNALLSFKALNNL